MSPPARRCRRKAEAEALGSLMKDTNWRDLSFPSNSFEAKLAWRTHDVLNGHLSDWDSEWCHHLGPDYCSIEWLEIDPRACDRESVRAVLREVGAPFEES